MKTFRIPFVPQTIYGREIMVLDADYSDLIEQYHTGGTEVFCLVRDEAVARPSWQSVTAEDFEAVRTQMRPPAQVI